MNNILTELQTALRAAGHAAEQVQRSPVDMLNVWLDGEEGHTPAATITVYYDSVDHDAECLVWGHRWEHSVSTSDPMDDIVRTIVETSRSRH